MTSPFPIDAQNKPDGPWKIADIQNLPPTLRHRIASAGFEIAQLEISMKELFNRLDKGRLKALTANTIRSLFGQNQQLEPDGTIKAAEFAIAGNNIKLIASSKTTAADPRCWALLHLPGLRSWWSQALRRSHFESLLSLIPNAWATEDIALPPGAVIAGLDIPDWSHLTRCIEAGRKFVLWNKSGPQPLIDQSLKTGTGAVLIEQPHDEQRIQADYDEQGGRIELKRLRVLGSINE